MPIYEYECPDCGQFELIQKITEDAISECPTCKESVKRLVSASAFHLKGTGWYKTDYPTSGSAGTAPKKTLEAKGEAKETKTTESTPKPAEKTTTTNSD